MSAISTHLPQSSLHIWGSSINCFGPEQKGTVYLLALASVFYSWGVGLWDEKWETTKLLLTRAWIHADSSKPQSSVTETWGIPGRRGRTACSKTSLGAQKVPIPPPFIPSQGCHFSQSFRLSPWNLCKNGTHSFLQTSAV